MHYYKITNNDGTVQLDCRNIPYYMPDTTVQEITEVEYLALEADLRPEPEESSGYIISDEEISAAYAEGVQEA